MQKQDEVMPMKAPTLTISAREPSRDYTNLAELDQRVFALLTQDGPVFQTGSVLVAAEAFETVLPVCLWMGLALHECGRFGACDPEEAAENALALTRGGTVVSRWCAQDAIEFNVETTLEAEYQMTTVLVSPDIAAASDPGPSAIRLGDIVIDDSLHPVPLDQIWFALREHEMGSPGDTDLFPRRSSFDAGSIAVSWWTHPLHPELSSWPFWVLTHLAEPRQHPTFTGDQHRAGRRLSIPFNTLKGICPC
jgi:hypothetical protein